MKLGVTLLAAMALVGACSSDASPREPEPAPTTTSASPTRAVPTMPAQASEDSPAGAAAFVKHYVAVFNYAANTGDTEAMQALSNTCAPCDSYAKSFRAEPDDGERFGGILWNLNKLVVGSTRDPLEVEADLHVREGTDLVAYSFIFELTPRTPFKVRDIRMLEPS